jgi:very-short-patch-repair endonuclease
LLAFGFSPDAIRHRIRRGRLVVIWPGVYRVGRMPLTREGRFMAAILACGEGAVLSHDSAASMWRIRNGGTNPIHVSVPHHRRIRLEGIQVHRRNPMPPATTKQNLPLSRPLFTLVDLAATLEPDPLEAAINEADRLNLLDPDEIERELRLPMPTTQEHVGRGRIDFHSPDLNLVVETDGLTYHRTPMQQLEDRRRDQAHAAAGRIQLRFANLQIREEPDEVAAVLAAVVTRANRGTLPRR